MRKAWRSVLYPHHLEVPIQTPLAKDAIDERLGQTILMITHNPEAAAYGHHIVQMRDGKIV